MTVRAHTSVVIVAAWLAATVVVLPAQSAPPQQQAPPQGVQTSTQAPQAPPVFRGGTVLIPIDVRVIDRNGQPVTDLTQADFTVRENGQPQTIRHFSTQSFEPQPTAPSGALVRHTTLTNDITPQTNRIFLIMLGRGRLQEPSKGVDATLTFIRQHLLPQDQVSVFAYDRATDFTTDHEQAAQVVERFKKQHERVERDLSDWFSGLRAIYGSKDIPTKIQGEIDAIFAVPGAPGPRQVPPGSVANQAQNDRDTRAATDLLQHVSSLDTVGQSQLDLLDMDFDDYVQTSASTFQDLTNLYTGIDYLRHIEGEKHLVFVSENGLFLPNAEAEQGLAGVASDARVVIDTIQTGGIPSAPVITRAGARAGGGPGPSFTQSFALQSLKTIAAQTGGQSSIAAYADKAYTRIDNTSRFEYVLGYYPVNQSWDGRFRRVVVTVDRPGLTVLYRHGYNANPTLAPLDRQQIVTYSRVAAAGNYAQPVTDIKIQLQASLEHPTPTTGTVDLTAVIDLSRVSLASTNGLHVGQLNIAVFCGDNKENVTGELWQNMNLNLKDDTYTRLMKDGVTYTAKVPLKGPAQYVKIIVYDYGADLVGSTSMKIKTP
jgi:VWFA-related protein